MNTERLKLELPGTHFSCWGKTISYDTARYANKLYYGKITEVEVLNIRDRVFSLNVSDGNVVGIETNTLGNNWHQVVLERKRNTIYTAEIEHLVVGFDTREDEPVFLLERIEELLEE